MLGEKASGRGGDATTLCGDLSAEEAGDLLEGEGEVGRANDFDADHTCFSSRLYSSWLPIQNQVTVSPWSNPNAR